MPLKVNEELKKLEPVEEAEAAPPPSGGGLGSGMGMSSGMMGGMPMPGGPEGRGGGAAAVDSTRVNKIPRPRYIQVTPQARHLPIAIRLVVDQGHIQDVLTAVSNSLLRIQITQVSVHHLRNVTRGTSSGPGGGGATPGGMPPMGGMGGTDGNDSGMGMSGGMGMMMGRGGRPMGGGEEGQPYNPYIPGSGSPSGPGGTFTGTGPADTTSKFVDNAKLVELSIHGIAALYERFPAKKKDAAATDSTPK